MYLKRSQRQNPASIRPEGRPYFVTPMSSRGCLLLFCFFFLISSCHMTEEPDWRPPHPVTVPYTCESADYFIRIGEEEIGSVFFIGDSTRSFYSFWQNNIFKYGLPGLQGRKVYPYHQMKRPFIFPPAIKYQAGFLQDTRTVM